MKRQGDHMKIISKEEMEYMFEALHPNLNESNIISTEDEELSKVLKYYLFLKQFERAIIANSTFTYEEILYSQYYWFFTFKKQYSTKVRYDGGMDQQAFLLIERLCDELEGEVDWGLIEEIENRFKIE
jgi:hypothetical protein